MTSATYFQNVLILGSKTFVQHAWAKNAALHLGIVERSCVEVQKLPAGALLGAELLSRHRSNEPVSADPLHIRDELGVQRMNDDCLELGSGGHLVKSIYGSAIGVLFVMGIGASLLTSLMLPGQLSGIDWLLMALAPVFGATFGALLYAGTRGVRGSFVRVNRETQKVYYVFPRNEQLVTLDWDALQALAGYVPIVGAAGYSSRHPLCLVGIDWTQSPPAEVSVSCGKLGWRDQGASARELWDYVQRFMQDGPRGLPTPPPLPPRMSRKQTFLYGYRQWAKKFREDLATPKGKRWKLVWAPAKVLWLITIVFPDSIGDYLDYTIPDIMFPKQIDQLCGFDSGDRKA